MKINRLLVLLAVAACVAGCKKEAGSIERPAEEVEVIPELSVSVTTLLYYAEQSTRELTFSSTSAWNISCSDSWVSVSASSGSGNQDDYQVVDVSVEQNTSEEARTATLTLSSGSLSYSVNIRQYGYEEDVYIVLGSDDSVSFDSEGGSTMVSFSTNSSWEASCDADWISIEPSSGDGDDSIMVTVEENTTYEERTATITIVVDGEEITIEITQAAAETPSAKVSPQSLSFEAEGGSQSISLTANYAWTAESDASWLTLSPASGEASDDAQSISVKADANEAYTSRSATITFTLSDGQTKATVSVSQAAAEEPKVSVTPSSVSFEYGGGSQSVSLSANYAWTAESDASWLTLSPSSGEASDNAQSVNLVAEANTTTSSRTATVTFTLSDGSTKATVSVTQQAVGSYTVTEAVSLADDTDLSISGTVAAVTRRGFILYDGTSAIFVYDKGANSVAIGDEVSFSAVKSTYANVAQLGSVTNFTTTSTGGSVSYPSATDITSQFDSYSPSKSGYVTVTGALSVSGSYYNLSVDGASTYTGSIYYPSSDLSAGSYDGKTVKVTGFYGGYLDSYKYIVAVSIEEVAKEDTNPIGGIGEITLNSFSR